jgi:hypothetical protein
VGTKDQAIVDKRGGATLKIHVVKDKNSKGLPSAISVTLSGVPPTPPIISTVKKKDVSPYGRRPEKNSNPISILKSLKSDAQKKRGASEVFK